MRNDGQDAGRRWALAVSVGLAGWLGLAIALSATGAEKASDQVAMFVATIALYGLLAAWGWRRGGRRKLCSRNHASWWEREKCSKVHRRDFIGAASVAGITGVVELALVADGAFEAAALFGMLPMTLVYLATTYLPSTPSS